MLSMKGSITSCGLSFSLTTMSLPVPEADVPPVINALHHSAKRAFP